MYLIYIDESGDTGLRLNDPQQPVFLMAALAMEENQWAEFEDVLLPVVKEHFNGEIPVGFELHATDLVNRRMSFKTFTRQETYDFRDDILKLVEKFFAKKIFYMSIDKKRFDVFCREQYGDGVRIQPYIMALPFICMNIDNFLKKEKKRGILIFDEHREGASDAEQALKVLRLDKDSSLNTSALIEKGFFIDSKKSYPIQVIDMVAYYLRKYEEFQLGHKVSSIHQQTFDALGRIAINVKEEIQAFTDYSSFIEKCFMGDRK
jgi:Protein of unknown function (DUF3800)